MILLSSESFVCWFIIFDNMSMVSPYPEKTISCKVSLFITSVASDVGRILYELLLFLVLSLVVMVILLLLVFISSVNNERLSFSFSHLFFSCYESILFLCAFFLESPERDQPPPCIDSFNE